MTGLFFELGPSTISTSVKPEYNEDSWNNKANVIFLDQPVNTGYSYGDGVGSTVAASKDIYALLTLFFKQFPEYSKQDFHIAGESYAGHYIPADASEILSHPNTNINLKSILIGNGLTDALNQYPEYVSMACGEGGYPAKVSESTCRSMRNSIPNCKEAIQSCYDSGDARTCTSASQRCRSLTSPYYRTGLSPYDVRKECESDNGLCYKGMDYVQEYLNKDEVKEALGVEVRSFENCNGNINYEFHQNGDDIQPIQRYVPDILKEVPVLVYAGDADYICNWLGNRAWTDALDWSGKDAYGAAETKNLTLDGSAYGTIKSAEGLSFSRIFGAGHLVPMDKPAPILDLVNRWIDGEWSK